MSKFSENYLYKFLSLPSEKWSLEILKNDGIILTDKTTIQNILEQRYKKPIAEISENYHLLTDPYLNLSLYRINFVINEESLWAGGFRELNDIFDGAVWIGRDILLENSSYEMYRESMLQKNETPLTQKDYEADINLSFETNEAPLPIKFDDTVKMPFGVISFCRNYNHPLMWGHYSNGHNGVCIQFSPHENLSEICKTPPSHDGSSLMQIGTYDPGGHQIFWSSICYATTPLQITKKLVKDNEDIYMDLCRKYPKLKTMLKTPQELLTLKNIMSKDSQWEKESEIRLFFIGVNGKIPLKKFFVPVEQEKLKSNGNQPYLTMDSIILGNKITPKGILYNLIKNSIKESRVPIKRVVPKAASYDLKIVDIE